MASRSLRLTLLPVLASVLVAPSTGAAVDFDCYDHYDHCLAQERDNLTFYVDTDGSMNVDSGRNVDGSSGNETYWEAVMLSLDEFVSDNHVNGNCNSCEDDDCDGVRVGVGFYGDDSTDDSGDGLNAYRAVTAGENKRDDVEDALDLESAGNVGLPGIEKLTCPEDGSGQLDTFTCPADGTAQVERIECPPNGTLQIEEIVCPPVGMPQVTTAQVLRAPGGFTPTILFTLTIDGNTVTYLATVPDSTTDIATELVNEALMVTALDPYTITSAGPVITIEGPDSLTSFTTSALVPTNFNINDTPNSPGLPDDPSDSDTFEFDINSMTVTVPSATTTSVVCDNVVSAVEATSEPVDVIRVSANTVRIQSTAVGDSFTFVPPADGLAHTNIAAGMAGLPGDPGTSHNYEFTINSSTISYVQQASDNTSVDVCAGIKQAIIDSGEPVTVDDLVLVGNAALDITAATPGQGFSINVPGPSELGHSTLQNNVAGFPGTPGAGHNYTFDFNSSTITIDSTGMTTSSELCAAIESELDATGVVEATATGTSVEVVAVEDGGTWDIDNVDGALGHSSMTGPGLPGNPPANHAYHLEIDGIDVDWTDDGSPTQAEVCAGIAQKINDEAGSVVSAMHDGTEITITGVGPAPFFVENYDSSMTHTVERVAGLGVISYGDLGARIDDDLDISARRQNALVITHRAPDDYADLSLSIAALCSKRDDEMSPATTHFIGLDMSAEEMDLMHVLAAAGGSGECSTDPCTGVAVQPDLTLSPGVSCSGALSAHAGNLKNRIYSIVNELSCTLELDVPPSYADGQAPSNPWAVYVQIRSWDLEDLDGRPRVYHPAQCQWWGCYTAAYDWILYDWYDVDWDDARDYEDEGWEFVPGDRSQIRFTDEICEDIRRGDITRIRTEVGCECPNQGEECTDASVEFTCKSQTGEGTQPCTAEQLANMRCATGVYICDDGVEVCSASGTNAMPEICNGIDDDCDGIIDNLSNASEDDFDGEDVEGKNCNFRDVCVCPDGWQDTPSAGTDLEDHLNSWSVECSCGEGLEPAERNYTPIGETQPEPASSTSTDRQAACATGMGAGDASVAALALFGLLGLRRRRR